MFSFYSVLLILRPSKTTFAQPDQTTEIQTRLKQWGYYNGPVDGVLNSETQQAIKSFQASNGLNQTGNADAVTLQALGIYVSTQNSNDLYLIAKCIFAEARGEPYEGKVAVGAVILNRVKNPDFPNTVYGVIYQSWAFTAVHDGQINLEPDTVSYQAAQDAVNGWDPTYGCIYYYNPAKATNQWIYSREVVVVIGKHYFAK
jgi:N-acetylmuramoyl-L-alanine amidase